MGRRSVTDASVEEGESVVPSLDYFAQQIASALLQPILEELRKGVPHPPSAHPSAATWLDTEQAAAHVGIKRNTLEVYRTQGGGPEYVKVGRKVKYSLAALDAWMSSKRRAHT